MTAPGQRPRNGRPAVETGSPGPRSCTVSSRRRSCSPRNSCPNQGSRPQTHPLQEADTNWSVQRAWWTEEHQVTPCKGKTLVAAAHWGRRNTYLPRGRQISVQEPGTSA